MGVCGCRRRCARGAVEEAVTIIVIPVLVTGIQGRKHEGLQEEIPLQPFVVPALGPRDKRGDDRIQLTYAALDLASTLPTAAS